MSVAVADAAAVAQLNTRVRDRFFACFDFGLLSGDKAGRFAAVDSRGSERADSFETGGGAGAAAGATVSDEAGDRGGGNGDDDASGADDDDDDDDVDDDEAVCGQAARDLKLKLSVLDRARAGRLDGGSARSSGSSPASDLNSAGIRSKAGQHAVKDRNQHADVEKSSHGLKHASRGHWWKGQGQAWIGKRLWI
eukprot:5644280-Pleurochrysis_carterae.AAC.1